MTEFDQLMEAASVALAKMDYLTCAAQCRQALGQARAQADWDAYARVLLPLQEARRHRRMMAAEGIIHLGSGHLTGEPADWLRATPAGCFVLTHPHTAATARALRELAETQRQFVEVLWADSASAAAAWTMHSYAGPEAACTLTAPSPAWRDQPFAAAPPWPTKAAPRTAAARRAAGAKDPAAVQAPGRPADWFIDATEALGDAALAQVDALAPPMVRIAALERCLEVVQDHEILHQRLWAAAREAQRRGG